MTNQNDSIYERLDVIFPLDKLIGKELEEFSHALHFLTIKLTFCDYAITQAIKRIELGDVTVDKLTAKEIKHEKKLIGIYLTLSREIENRLSADPFLDAFITDSEH
jgi:hypothetical protein